MIVLLAEMIGREFGEDFDIHVHTPKSAAPSAKIDCSLAETIFSQKAWVGIMVL